MYGKTRVPVVGEKVGFRANMKLTVRNSCGQCTQNGDWELKTVDEGVIERVFTAEDCLVKVRRATWVEPRWFLFPAALLKPRDNSARNVKGGVADVYDAAAEKIYPPAPREIVNGVLSVGFYTVILGNAHRANTLAHLYEFGSRAQAEQAAELCQKEAGQAGPQARHYNVVQCVSRLEPFVEPPAPIGTWHYE